VSLEIRTLCSAELEIARPANGTGSRTLSREASVLPLWRKCHRDQEIVIAEEGDL